MSIELIENKNSRGLLENSVAYSFFDYKSLRSKSQQEDFAKHALYINNNFYKILLDKTLSLLAIIILLPFLIFVALLIMFESKGSPLFFQSRTGLYGKEFKIVKFRTMTVCENGNTVTQACRNDVRVTFIGSILRRTSIDEIPQLFNVLMGDMSLIGPRPHAIAHDKYYGAVIEEYNNRFFVRPGISGLAQVSGSRGPTETIDKMEERVYYDLEYTKNWNIQRDFDILNKTVQCVFSLEAF